jgi:hypothetical protein
MLRLVGSTGGRGKKKENIEVRFQTLTEASTKITVV